MNCKKAFWTCLLFSIFLFPKTNRAQKDSTWQQKTFFQKAIHIPPHFDKKRFVGVSGTYVAAWTGAIVALNEIWYKNYPKSSFHTFDDSREWLQVDKIGHGYSAYQLSRIFGNCLKWSGLNRKKCAWIGGVSGIVSQSVIEILDGYSAKWGFSWSDMIANGVGSTLYTGQEVLWGEQRILFKFSTHRIQYPAGVLEDRARNLYGTTAFELIFKDYNAQTYWFSTNLRSFFPDSKIPKWLNIAVGYGADGMYGGFENKWIDEARGQQYDRTDIPRLRQFFISPDIDLSRINTKSGLVNWFFRSFNLKIPMPALEFRSDQSMKFHALYF